MKTDFFRDPRSKECDNLSFQADRMLVEDREKAQELYAQCAKLRYDVATTVPRDMPKVRRAMYLDAFYLFMRADLLCRAWEVMAEYGDADTVLGQLIQEVARRFDREYEDKVDERA